MRRSIRARLQVWYGLILLAVVSGFAGLLFYRVSAAKYQQVDAELSAAALYLDANLRRFPPFEFEGPPGQRHAPDRRDLPRPPPFRPSRERLLADLDLPRHDPTAGGGAPAYFVIWRADGSTLKSAGPVEALAAESAADDYSPTPRLRQRSELREIALLGPGASRILVGRSVAAEYAELRAFGWQLAGVGAVVLAVGLAGGWLISARILRPVAAITRTAAAISASHLSERIDPDAVDRELSELAGVLNATFTRLEAAFERQARFTADASHELRTPLAIIRSHAELALARPRAADEYRETVAACLRAAGRMTAVVEGLLTLARADAGKLDLRSVDLDLGRCVEDCADLVERLAAQNGITITRAITPTTVRGDADRLAQVVLNLLTNAILHNRPNGTVTVEVSGDGKAAMVKVTDTGPGILEADQPHVFERFFRVDKARSREHGGSGLGLAICKSIVEAHGGTIGFTSAVNQGSTFWFRLPRDSSDLPHLPQNG